MSMSSSPASPVPPVPVFVGSFQGEPVLEYQLCCPSTGVVVKVLNWGAVLRDWQVPLDGPGSESRSVVLGFERFDDYVRHSPFFGAVIGRVANRIGGAKFTLDGKEYALEANEGLNQLHGGKTTFGKRIWQLDTQPKCATNSVFGELSSEWAAAPSVRLSLNSAHGEGNYPGNLAAEVTYRLVGHKLRMEFVATTDAPTPVNLVQHHYFNLAGGGSDIREHTLRLAADAYTPMTQAQVPTGDILPVQDSELDFRGAGRELKDASGEPLALDHNFVLAARDTAVEPAAVLEAPDKSLRLALWTNQPGLQVYTAKWLKPPLDATGLNGVQYGPFGAICLEDQHFPDAINHPDRFPSPVLRPGEVYAHWCEIEIAPTRWRG